MPHKDPEVAKAYFKNYHAVNSVAVKAAQKKCYDAKPEYYKAKARAYHHANRDSILPKARAYWKKNRDVLVPKLRAHRAKNIDAYRKRERAQYWTPHGLNSKLLRTFGITVEQYEAMLAAQNGVCAICFSKHKTMRLSVDHCHKTGKVRGLLCGKCNSGIGMLSDSIDLLASAQRYLERF